MSTSGGASELPTVITPNNPAAGADWSFTLTQAGTLQAIRARLACSAVVANRFIHFRITDPSGNIVYQTPGPTAQGAGQTITYNCIPGTPYSSADTSNFIVPIPEIPVGVGWVISSLTSALDAGDQWSNLVLTFTDR